MTLILRMSAMTNIVGEVNSRMASQGLDCVIE
jgi:hypothetical protein